MKISHDTIEYDPIQVPTSWSEINLKTYKNLQEYYKSLKEDETVDSIKLIAILSNKTEDEIFMLPMQFISSILEKLNFLKQLPNPKPSKTIKIGSDSYSINSMENMAFGEWVDANQTMKSDPNDYASFLAVVCRKSGELYDQDYISNKFEQRKEMFENISVEDALSVLGFFLSLSIVSSQLSQDSINRLKEEVSALVEDTESLLKHGGYSIFSTFSARRTLRKYKKLLNRI